MSNLKPCPFCGDEASIEWISVDCAVECKSCCARGPRRFAEQDADDVELVQIMDDAEAAWNERT